MGIPHFASRIDSEGSQHRLDPHTVVRRRTRDVNQDGLRKVLINVAIPIGRAHETLRAIAGRERNIGARAFVETTDARTEIMTDDIAGPEQARLFTRIALNTWKATVGRFDDIVAASTDEDLEREVTVGQNRLSYLIGHLTTLHDRLLPLLGLGDRQHTEFDAEFSDERDAHRAIDLSASRLREAWNDVNAALVAGMERLTPEQWLEKASTLTDASRLSVLLNWTSHVSQHSGQIRLTR